MKNFGYRPLLILADESDSETVSQAFPHLEIQIFQLPAMLLLIFARSSFSLLLLAKHIGSSC